MRQWLIILFVLLVGWFSAGAQTATGGEASALDVSHTLPQSPVLFLPDDTTINALEAQLSQPSEAPQFLDAEEGVLNLTLVLEPDVNPVDALSLQFCLNANGTCSELLVLGNDQAYASTLTLYNLRNDIETHTQISLLVPPPLLRQLKASVPVAAADGFSEANTLTLSVHSPQVANSSQTMAEIQVLNLPHTPSNERVDTSMLGIASYNNSWGQNFSNNNFGVRFTANVNNKSGNKNVFYNGRTSNFKFTERSVTGDMHVKVFGREFRILRGFLGGQGFHRSASLSFVERSIRTVGNILLWGQTHTANQWYNYCQFNQFKDAFSGGGVPDVSACQPNKYSDGKSYRHEVGHSSTFIVVNIPVTVEAFVGGEVGVQWYLEVDRQSFQQSQGMKFEMLTAGGGGYVVLDARAAAFVNLGAVHAGIQGLLSIMSDEISFVTEANIVSEQVHGYLRNFLSGPNGSVGPFVRYYDVTKTCTTQQCQNVPYAGNVCVDVPYPCPTWVEHYYPLVSWSVPGKRNWNFIPFGFKCNLTQGCFGNFTSIPGL